MSPPDPYGDQVDADSIEDAFRDSLKAWLPAHLAHQERRRGWPQGKLPRPSSWPTVSEFDLRRGDKLPAVVIVSRGTTGPVEHLPRGVRRKTWVFEVAVAIAARNETEARQLAAVYLAAITAAAEQGRSLGGVVEGVREVGPDDHAFGTAAGGGQRAIYGTAFHVIARTAAPPLALTVPPADPYQPPAVPPGPNTAIVDVTLEAP